MQEIEAIEVGALKTNGLFDIYYYSPEPANFQELIRSVMTNYPNYLYMAECKIDKEWNDYFNFIYPAEFEFQTILNQRVLDNLEDQGNRPDILREVDHCLYFNTESSREDFIAKTSELGYKVVSNENMNDQGHSFQLVISRMNDTHRDSINDCVWELITLAKEYEASYDGWGCCAEK